jgi:formate--tetrahydrofolate ligase
LIKHFENLSFSVEISKGHKKGGAGVVELAQKVVNFAELNSVLKHPYSLNDSTKNKINAICKKIYHAKNVIFSRKADAKIKQFECKNMLNNLPVCIAKTQYSFTDDQTVLGAPSNFDITIRDIYLSNGASFIVALAGDIMTMPGLSKKPNAMNIDITDDYKIKGIF